MVRLFKNNQLTVPASCLFEADWLIILNQILEEDTTEHKLKAILLMISQHKGSAPREKGSWLILTPKRQYGTLGGGELEYRASKLAKEMLQSARENPSKMTSDRILEDFLLGPDLGQCCGGAISLIFQPIATDAKLWIQSALTTPLASKKIGFSLKNLRESPIILENDSEHKDYHIQSYEDNRSRFYIIGGGHVGQSVALMAMSLPLQVFIMDGRPEILDNLILPPNANASLIQNDDFLKTIPAKSSVVVMTHSHDLDYHYGKELLKREDLAFIGIIGSKTKTARFRKNFLEDGINLEQLSRLNMPIAPMSPKGKEPGVIALGLLYQILNQNLP